MKKPDKTNTNTEVDILKKNSKSVTKQSIVQRAKQFWMDMWDIEKEFSRVATFFVNILKVVTVSANKFIRDDGLSHASATAYTAVVSLIPMLTVGFSLFSAYGGLGTKKEEIIHMAEQYIKEHNLNIDITPFTNAIISVTDNAAGIGGIGLLVLIFSATSVLRTLESTFNNIWRVKVQRSMLMKIIYYWAALTLGPMLLAVGGSLAGIMANVFTMPSIYTTAGNAHSIWLAGDRGLLVKTNPVLAKKTPIDFAQVDFDNQRAYTVSTSLDNKSVSPVSDENRTTALISVKDLKKAKFSAIAKLDVNIYIASEDGILLKSNNNGASWNLIRLGTINFTGNFVGLKINHIYYLDKETGFIASDNGLILQTKDGGRNWVQILPQTENSAINLQLFNYHRVYFYGNRGFILGSKSALLISEDLGNTWTLSQLDAAKVRNKPVSLTGIHGNASNDLWIVGEDGLILYSNDRGKKWIKRNKGEQSLFAVLALNTGEAVVSGRDGYLLYTKDKGERWIREKKAGWNYYSLLKTGKDVIAFGDNFSAHRGTIDSSGIRWKKIIGGKSFFYSFINFLAPFAVIWLLFIIAYITLPNTKVPFKPAALGASVTSAVWVIFILSFMYYVKNMTGGTQAIYGALAIIPIFLLMIYASAVITLVGAEITYTLHHPATYKSSQVFKKKDMEEIYLYDAVHILYTIHRNYELGKGATAEKDLQLLYNSEPEGFTQVMKIFVENSLIEYLKENNTYLPAKAAKLVTLDEITDLVMQRSFIIPSVSTRNRFTGYMNNAFMDLEKYRKQKLSKITLQNLLDNFSKDKEDEEIENKEQLSEEKSVMV